MGRRKGRDNHLPAIDEVLNGRLVPSIGQLFALIREINPTARDFSPALKAARYADKNRLIALLVDKYLDDLWVSREDADPRVVTFRRRAQPDELTHALLPELPEVARSKVTYFLDTVEAEAVAQVKTAPQSPGGLLIAAKRAQAEYDYESAISLYQAATAEDGVVAAAALLELWVGLLVQDADALGWIQNYPELIQAPSVARWLALAAARTGDWAAARRWFALDEGQAEEILPLLVSQAIAAGDRLQAEKDWAKLKEQFPLHPGLNSLSAKISELRKGDRAPQEARLLALWERGELDLVESEARRILVVWPESEVARERLREVQVTRRELRMGQLSQEIEQKRRREDFGGAMRLLKELKILQGQAFGQDDLLAELELLAKQQDDFADAENLSTLFDESPEKALGVLADLSDERRARVLEFFNNPYFIAIREGLTQKIAPKPLVAAVFAWFQATQLDPEAANVLIANHEKYLIRIAVARPWLADLEVAVKKALREKALTKAEQLRDIALAKRSALDLEPESMTEEEMDTLTIEEVIEFKKCYIHILTFATFAIYVSKIKECLRKGSFIAALDLLRNARPNFGVADQREFLNQLEVRVEQALAKLIPNRQVVGDIRWAQHGSGRELLLITPDGEQIYCIVSMGNLISIRILGMVSQRIEVGVVIRCPGFFGAAAGWFDDNQLMLADETGRVMAFRLSTWSASQRVNLNGVVSGQEAVELVTPLSRELALAVITSSASKKRTVLFAWPERVIRVWNGVVNGVPGAEGEFVLVGEDHIGYWEGEQLKVQKQLPLALHRPCHYLGSQGWLIWLAEPKSYQLLLAIFNRNGEIVSREVLCGQRDRVGTVFGLEDTVWHLSESREQEYFLSTYQIQDTQWVLRQREPSTAGRLMGREGHAVWIEEGARRVRRLGVDPPIAPGDTDGMLAFGGDEDCEWQKAVSLVVGMGIDDLRLESDSVKREAKRQWLASNYRLIGLFEALVRQKYSPEDQEKLLEEHQDVPAKELMAASIHVRYGRWHEALRLLDVAPAPRAYLRHYYHVRGVVFWMLGRFEPALEAFRAGCAAPRTEVGWCYLDAWRNLAEAKVVGTPGVSRKILDLLAAAQSAWDAGRAREVIQTLDDPVLARLGSQRVNALRVQAYLAAEPEGEADWFNRLVACQLLDNPNAGDPFAPLLPPSPADLWARAADWLSQQVPRDSKKYWGDMVLAETEVALKSDQLRFIPINLGPDDQTQHE